MVNWEAVSAVATGISTIIALFLACWSICAENKRAFEFRKEQEARRQEFAIAVRLSEFNSDSEPLRHYYRVVNGSNAAIMSVLYPQVVFQGEGGSISEDTCMHICARLLKPHGSSFFDVPEDRFPDSMYIEFTDARGVRWRRGVDSSLSEV